MKFKVKKINFFIAPIDFDASLLTLQNAINDLPTIGPNMANVSINQSSIDTLRIFTVKFSASLGNLLDIKSYKSKNLRIKKSKR